MISKLVKFKIVLTSSYISNAMHVIMTNSLVYYNLSFDKNGDAIITAPSTMRKQYIELFNQNFIDADFSNDLELVKYLRGIKKDTVYLSVFF